MPIQHKETLYQTFIAYWTEYVAAYGQQPPQNVYAPIHYITQGGGKRMRPLFMLMVGQMFGEAGRGLPACFAVELFHNFTLLHDDIMDEAPLRRGRATVHEKWDTNTAILSGDLMMIESLRHLRHIGDASIRAKVSDHFLQGAVAVCEGQQMDMDFEQRDDVELPEYMQMIGLKTAALLAEGMAMAAICCGASDKQAAQVREAGLAIGTAFQIQDDILDTYGDPAKFGKKVGGDIAQNKKTYLYLRALELADEATKQEILSHYSSSCPLEEKGKIAKVTALFDQVGIHAVAEQEKARYTQRGFQALEGLGVGNEAVQVLEAFALKLLEREA